MRVWKGVCVEDEGLLRIEFGVEAGVLNGELELV